MHRPLVLENQDWPGKKTKKSYKVWYILAFLFFALIVYFVLYSSQGLNIAQANPNGDSQSISEKKEQVKFNKTEFKIQSKIKENSLIQNYEEKTLIFPENPNRVQVAMHVKPENPESLQTISLKIRHSLTYSFCKNKMTGDCQFLAALVARLLSWRMDVNRSLRKGDSLHLVYKTLDNPDRFRILKLSYTSRFLNQTLQMNYFRTPTMVHGSYFDKNGREVVAHLGPQSAPILKYEEITSLPGDFREGRPGHAGTDFKTIVGSPVFSSFEGQVTRINWNRRRNGNCIEIDHPKLGIKTLYLHLDKVHTKPGQKVKQGELIADSGNTGRSFAPHLHYEIRSRDKKRIIYNPFKFKHHKKYRRQIPDLLMSNFLKIVKGYDQLLTQS